MTDYELRKSIMNQKALKRSNTTKLSNNFFVCQFFSAGRKKMSTRLVMPNSFFFLSQIPELRGCNTRHDMRLLLEKAAFPLVMRKMSPPCRICRESQSAAPSPRQRCRPAPRLEIEEARRVKRTYGRARENDGPDADSCSISLNTGAASDCFPPIRK